MRQVSIYSIFQGTFVLWHLIDGEIDGLHEDAQKY